MSAKKKLAKVRAYAVDLVASDDWSKWGEHREYSIGTELLRMIDGKPSGAVWDSRTSDWWVSPREQAPHSVGTRPLDGVPTPGVE